MNRFGCHGVLAVCLATATGIANSEVLYTLPFESGAPTYGTGWTYPAGSDFQSMQVTGQGWSGTNGHKLITLNGRRQYNSGWVFDPAPSDGWQNGDIVYVRFRVKYDANFRWDGAGSMQNKMVDFGTSDRGSRVILHQERPHSTTACGLPDSYYPNYGALSVKKNIGEPCTPPVPITYDTWYHVQFAVQSSTTSSSGDGYFKLWVNNNDFNNPSSQVFNVNITTDDWNSSWDFGGFITDAPARDQGFIVDDFQVATTFDPNWGSGSSTPAASVPDPAPTPEPTPAPTPVAATGNMGLPFTSGLETGNFSEWNGFGVTGAITASAQNPAQGNYAARIQLTQGTHSEGYVEHRFGDFYNIGLDKVEEAYLELDSKFDPGYVWPGDSQKIAILNLTNGTDSQRRYQVYVYVDRNGRYAVDHSDIANWRFYGLPQNVGNAVSVREGQWDHLKLYVRLNTPGLSDGVVQLWINGQLKVSYNSVNIRGGTNYGMGKLIVGSYATDASGSNGIQWWDNVMLSPIDPDITAIARPNAPVLRSIQ